MNTTREYRKENNLCFRCGKSMDRKGLYCTSCTAYMNALRKIVVNTTHSQGLCTGCKQPLDREGWFCTKCNNDLKKLQKIRVQKRKEDGLCIQCGASASPGRVRCAVCLEKNKLAIRAKRLKDKSEG